MDVNVMLRKKIAVNVIPLPDGTDIADSSARGFLHHVSKLSRQDELAFSVHNIDLYLQGVAADACPGKSAHNSDLIAVIEPFNAVAFFSEISGQIRLCDSDRFFLIFDDLFCRLAADFSDLSLQVAHSPPLLCTH